jgi:hypothetical protein
MRIVNMTSRSETPGDPAVVDVGQQLDLAGHQLDSSGGLTSLGQAIAEQGQLLIQGRARGVRYGLGVLPIHLGFCLSLETVAEDCQIGG